MMGLRLSFGTVGQGETDKGDDKPGMSPFSSLSMSIESYTPISMVNSSIIYYHLYWLASFFYCYLKLWLCIIYYKRISSVLYLRESVFSASCSSLHVNFVSGI